LLPQDQNTDRRATEGETVSDLEGRDSLWRLENSGAVEVREKVTHRNKNIPGWINWKPSKGIIQCEVLSPRKPGREWQMTQVFVGRLADRFPDKIVTISIQFPKA
jgi:hypothetical protein